MFPLSIDPYRVKSLSTFYKRNAAFVACSIMKSGLILQVIGGNPEKMLIQLLHNY